jgi:hypothetical protein
MSHSTNRHFVIRLLVIGNRLQKLSGIWLSALTSYLAVARWLSGSKPVDEAYPTASVADTRQSTRSNRCHVLPDRQFYKLK